MSEIQEYDTTPDENDIEDISSLEDHGEGTSSVITGQSIEGLFPDTVVYRLRLLYSNETFLAISPGEALDSGGMVLVPTRYGKDLAKVIGTIEKKGAVSDEIARIERIASSEDMEKFHSHKAEEEEAFKICKEKIETHGLEMKLVSVHYLLDEPKILFFFTAESRIDFRELVKDLVSVFKSRIELRQIGVRDESRVIGGLGICGRGYCCHSVSDKLKPVSIKMAKDQNLSLNSMKISGLCGRLLCCLAYEHQFYAEQRRLAPPENSRIPWKGETWKVAEVNIVQGTIKLVAEDGRAARFPFSAFEKTENRWGLKAGAATLS